MGCFICEKHEGLQGEPPGGYIYEDEHWMVCHFPTHIAVLGQLVIESKRHFLDFSDMTEEEAESYGVLLQTVYSVLRRETNAVRIYTLVMLEGADHFHVHLIPRSADSEVKGMELLAATSGCDQEEAVQLARTLRKGFSDTKVRTND